MCHGCEYFLRMFSAMTDFNSHAGTISGCRICKTPKLSPSNARREFLLYTKGCRVVGMIVFVLSPLFITSITVRANGISQERIMQEFRIGQHPGLPRDFDSVHGHLHRCNCNAEPKTGLPVCEWDLHARLSSRLGTDHAAGSRGIWVEQIEQSLNAARRIIGK